MKTLGEAAADVVANVRHRHLCNRLHSLGARALAEFLAELGAERTMAVPIRMKLERYAQLTPEALHSVGVEQESAAVLHVVDDGPGGEAA